MPQARITRESDEGSGTTSGMKMDRLVPVPTIEPSENATSENVVPIVNHADCGTPSGPTIPVAASPCAKT